LAFRMPSSIRDRVINLFSNDPTEAQNQNIRTLRPRVRTGMACRSVYITGPCDAGMAVEKLIEDFDWLKTAGHASAEHVDGERGLFLKFSGISGGF
jgi:hypothetical protein